MEVSTKRGHLQTRLLMATGHAVALDEMHQRARVGFLALHVVSLHIFHVALACDHRARTGQGLRQRRA